jgi:AcrR family transcriptional regulator
VKSRTVARSARSASDPRLSARAPTQERAKARVAAVLQEAEKLITEAGVSGFSIPLLAERLGYPRATIYKFFPTPYAIFNELALREVSQLEAHLLAVMQGVDESEPWPIALNVMVNAAATYYGRHPIACAMLLGGPMTDGSYRALELSITRLGRLARRALELRGLRVPRNAVDIGALAVECGTSSFRLSYFLHGRITAPYRKAAVDAMVAYIERSLGVRG